MSTRKELEVKVLEIGNNATKVIRLMRNAITPEEKAFWFLAIKDTNKDEGWGVKMELTSFPTDEEIQEFVNMEDKELFNHYYYDTVDKVSEYGLNIKIKGSVRIENKENNKMNNLGKMSDFTNRINKKICENEGARHICQDSMWMTLDAVNKILTEDNYFTRNKFSVFADGGEIHAVERNDDKPWEEGKDTILSEEDVEFTNIDGHKFLVKHNRLDNIVFVNGNYIVSIDSLERLLNGAMPYEMDTDDVIRMVNHKGSTDVYFEWKYSSKDDKLEEALPGIMYKLGNFEFMYYIKDGKVHFTTNMDMIM